MMYWACCAVLCCAYLLSTYKPYNWCSENAFTFFNNMWYGATKVHLMWTAGHYTSPWTQSYWLLFIFVAETKFLVKENRLIRNWLKITYVVEKMCSLDRTRGALYRGADKSFARPGRKKTNGSGRMGGISFGAFPCGGGGGGKLMTARVSMLLKSSASLTCFRACFLPGRAKVFSSPW